MCYLVLGSFFIFYESEEKVLKLFEYRIIFVKKCLLKGMKISQIEEQAEISDLNHFLRVHKEYFEDIVFVRRN